MKRISVLIAFVALLLAAIPSMAQDAVDVNVWIAFTDAGRLGWTQERAAEFNTLDGEFTSMPWNTSSAIWFNNMNYLNEAGVEIPTTWAEVEAACEVIMALENAPEYCFTFPNHGWFFEQWLVFGFVLITLMMPTKILILGLFRFVNSLGWGNTYLALICHSWRARPVHSCSDSISQISRQS